MIDLDSMVVNLIILVASTAMFAFFGVQAYRLLRLPRRTPPKSPSFFGGNSMAHLLLGMRAHS